MDVEVKQIAGAPALGADVVCYLEASFDYSLCKQDTPAFRKQA